MASAAIPFCFRTNFLLELFSRAIFVTVFMPVNAVTATSFFCSADMVLTECGADEIAVEFKRAVP